MVTPLDALALAAAGVLAGVLGSAGAITSLVSYPALLAVGLGALPASVANNVALVACWPGSALASRRELHGRGRWIGRWGLVAAAGGGAGAALLRVTSSGTFADIVPALVLVGSLALAAEPRLTRWRAARVGDAEPRAVSVAIGVFGLSVYNGYFGAGSGVMILTLMLVLVESDLPRANALKNMLIGAGMLAAAAVFALSGPVRWSAAGPLAAGMLLGSMLGPHVARRLPRELLRWLVVAFGVALAIQLWVDPTL